MTDALEVTVTAPVASFRNPLYPGLQVGLPCPPPSTVGGMLAAAAGGWEHVPRDSQFGMTFHAAGTGIDLETYHPLAGPGTPTNVTIKDREFLAHVTLTLWLTRDLELWRRALLRPVWPLRLGRSQDLVALGVRTTRLASGAGQQGYAVVPGDVPGAKGTALRLTTAVSPDRARSRWDTYRYAKAGASGAGIDTGLVTQGGQAVAMLAGIHPGGFSDGTAASLR